MGSREGVWTMSQLPQQLPRTGARREAAPREGTFGEAQGRARRPSKETVCGWEAARAPAGPVLRGIRGTRVMALTGLESLTFIFKGLPRDSTYSSLPGGLA